MNLHYCMGEFVGSAIFDETGESCGKCGMNKETGGNDCCKDEPKKFASEQSLKAYEMVQLSVPALPLNLDLGSHHFFSGYSSIHEAYPVSNAPPQTGKVYTYLQNCSFRI